MRLWKHQEEGIRRARDLDYFALLYEMGCGKTLTFLKILEEKFEKDGPLNTIIFCPLIVVQNFKREFDKFSSIKNVIPLVGTLKERTKTIKSQKEPAVLITNYEALYDNGLVTAIKEWCPKALVCDEIHLAKDSKAKRTKVLIDISDRCVYRYGLSGTPVLNSQLDLFSQIRILDGGKTFGKNFFVFRQQYFYDLNASRKGSHSYFPNWVPRPGIAEELNKKIAPFSMRVLKKDCLDLPPLLRKEVFVELGEEQARAYKQMKKDFITFVKDKACVASMVLTKTLRLQQIVSGFIKLEDDSEVTFTDNPRMLALESLISDITPTAKVIIWCVFRKNYEAIEGLLKRLKIGYATLHGDTLNPTEEIDRFQLDDATRVMIANPQAGGIGINLTAASYMIYYSKGFNLGHDLQSEARCYRGGSEIHQKITRIDLVANDTLDALITKVLAEKKDMGDAILNPEEVLVRLRANLSSI